MTSRPAHRDEHGSEPGKAQGTAATPDLRGIYPYLVSPIDESTGEVRREVLGALVEHLISQGVHGLAPLGSTREFACLSFDQRRDIVRTVVAAAKSRVPVVAGVAGYSTREAVELARAFVDEGADALALILQTYFTLPACGMEDFFMDVAASVGCPVCLHTNPTVLGSELSVDSIDRLSHVPNIQYVEDAGGETGRILSIMNRSGGRLKVFSASAHIPALVLQLGGVGWMAGPACVLPAESVALDDTIQAGRWPEAMVLQRELWRMNEIFAKFSLAAGMKAALQMQGFDVGDPIPPPRPVSPAGIAEIGSVLDSFAVAAGS